MWAYLLLEHANNNKNLNTKVAAEIGKLAHILLNAKSKQELSKSINIINDLLKYDSLQENSEPYLKSRLESMRNQIINYKLNHALPVKSYSFNELAQDFDSIKEKLSSLTIKEKNAPLRNSEHSHMDVTMSNETKQKYIDYLAEIQNKIQSGLIIDKLDIGTLLKDELKDYCQNDKNKISTMSLETFIDCLFKTTKPTIFAEEGAFQNGKKFKNEWTAKEYELLANTTKILIGVTAHTKITMNPQESDLISENNRPKTDFVYIHSPLIAWNRSSLNDFQSIFGTYDKNIPMNVAFFKERFNYDNYKKMLAERLLPGLIERNNAHPEGFIFTTPALGCYKFAGVFADLIKPEFEKALKEIIKEHHSQLNNLKAIVYTDGEQQNKTELLGDIPFISTNKKIGTAPQLEDSLFDNIPNITDKHKTYLKDNKKCSVVTFVAADPLSYPMNDFNSKSPGTHEGGTAAYTNAGYILTKQEGMISDNLTYQPNKREFWKDYISKIQIGKVKIINKENIFNIINNISANISNTQKLTQLCAICRALHHSNHKQHVKLANELEEKFLSAEVIEECDRTSPIYQIQFFLIELINVKTKHLTEKEALRQKLQAILSDPKSNDVNFVKNAFHLEVNKTLSQLKGNALVTGRLRKYLTETKKIVTLPPAPKSCSTKKIHRTIQKPSNTVSPNVKQSYSKNEDKKLQFNVTDPEITESQVQNPEIEPHLTQITPGKPPTPR